MRRNRSQTAKRRSHQGLTGTNATRCECGALRVSHRACPECGRYRGRIVIDVVERAKREERRTKKKEKELRESGRASEKDETPAEAK